MEVQGREAAEWYARCLHERNQDVYWELWVVEDGQVLDADLFPDGSDTFTIYGAGAAEGTEGIARHEGRLYFIPARDVADLPGGTDIWEVNENSPAGKTFMTCENEKSGGVRSRKYRPGFSRTVIL